MFVEWSEVEGEDGSLVGNADVECMFVEWSEVEGEGVQVGGC